ncbi:MAG: AI-2E family transporter [Chloroflexota bacterium]
MTPPWLTSPAQRTRLILSLLLLVLVVLIVAAAWAALVPFFIGLILAYLLLPLVNFLDRHAPRFLQRIGWSRPLAILLVYVALAGIVSGVLSYFVPLVSAQAKLLQELVPAYWDRITLILSYDLSPYLEGIPEQIRTAVDANIAKAADSLAKGVQKGIEVTFRTIGQTVSFVLGMVIVPFWLFYVLNEQARARRAFYALIPASVREDVRCIVTIIDELLAAYLRGQLLLCLIVGLMATVLLLVMGIEAPLLLGTVAGALELIPILGPYLGALPAVLIALIQRPILALWVGLGFAAIQQVENLFLVPRISGNAVRFHPAVVMVLVLMGSQIAGLWGLLLALPVAAMLRDVFRYLFIRTTERGATPQMALESLRARTL